MTGTWPCPDNQPGCNLECCVGHCPMCRSNRIGGGGANGMFCVSCGYGWGHEDDESFLDYFQRKVDGKDSDKL